MAVHESRPAKLSPDAWRHLEDRVGKFESAWARGERPEIADYLPDDGADPTTGRLLLELVHAELEFRIEAGESARVEEYFGRFPELAERSDTIADLVKAEYRLRQPLEPGLGRAEYDRRFEGLVGPLAALLDSGDTLADGAAPTRPAAESGLGRPHVPGFRLGQVLGRGGMGVVYEALDLELGRTVAVKILHASSDPFAGERLRREAEAAAGLRHPNVVEVYRIGGHAGVLFVAMELLPGGTLGDRIGGTPLPAHEAAGVLEPVARAVAAAHARVLIHRDLKPANILFGPDGRTPKIVDFGLAKRLDDDTALTRPGIAAGSPSYMSPEQAIGSSDVGLPADIWALGAVLYESLTGRPAFRGPSAAETLELVRHTDPVAPRRLVPRLPRDIEIVCLKCLEKDPGQRYASAAELADDLARFRRGEPVEARPVGPVGVTLRWARRNRTIATLLVLLAVSLAGGTATSIWAAARAVDFAEAAAERERFARRLLFASDMTQAMDAIRMGNAARADELLAEHAERTSGGLGFVRGHLERMTRVPETWIGSSFGGAVHFVCYAPDGRTLATGGEAGEVRFYRTGTWELLSHWATEQGKLNGLGFSPDGERLASAGDDGTVVLWEAASGRQLWRIRPFETRAHGVAFGLGGQVLATCGQDRYVRLLDPATGRQVAALEADGDPHRAPSGVEGLVVTPDGRTLIAGGRTRPSAWDLETRSPLWQHAIIPAGNRFTSVACSPDGQFAAFGTPHTEVLVVAVATGKRLHFGPFPSARPTVKGDAHRVVTFRDEEMLAVGCDSGAVRLACVSSAGLVRPTGPSRLTWQAHTARIPFIGRSPDGLVVTTSRDGDVSAWQPDEVPAWRMVPVGPRSRGGELAGNTSLAYGASVWVRVAGRDRLVSVRDDGVTVIDPDTGGTRHVSLGPGEWRYATSHPLGSRAFVAARGVVAAWECAGPDPAEVWRTEASFANGGKVGPGSTDGRIVAAMLSHNVPEVPTDYWVALFDAETGEMLRRRKLEGPVCPPIVTLDGRAIAVSTGWTILILDAATLATRLTLDGHRESVQAVACSPDGLRLASSGLDGRLITWDLERGQPLRDWRPDIGHVRSLAFSPDGQVLLSSTEGLPPRCWDAETGRLLLEPGPAAVEAAQGGANWQGATFSFDGSRISAGGGRQVAIFDGHPLEK
jgi:WD40 repeat protein